MATHEQVLLKRGYRTPLGRFRQSVGGEPTLIPKRVIRAFGLPSDAVIVDEDYVPPSQREPEDEFDNNKDFQAELDRRVNAKMAEQEARRRGERMKKQADAAEELGAEQLLSVLQKPVATIISNNLLEDFDLEELQELEVAEQENRGRKGVLAAISEAIHKLETSS